MKKNEQNRDVEEEVCFVSDDFEGIDNQERENLNLNNEATPVTLNLVLDPNGFLIREYF